MASSSSATRAPPVRRWLTAAPAAAALAATGVLVALLGLRWSARLLWWLADRLPQPRANPLPPRALAEGQARAIARIAERIPFKPQCLPRALLLAGSLRRRRIAADLCLGTRVGGAFDAHAWVEVDRAPVNEAADLPTAYRCLWRLPTLNAEPRAG